MINMREFFPTIKKEKGMSILSENRIYSSKVLELLKAKS